MEAVSFGTNTYSNDEILKTQFANGALASRFWVLNDIDKFMSGKMASVNPYIGANRRVRGGATPKI
jgi:zinc protease